MRSKRIMVAAASCLLILACVLTQSIEDAAAFEYVQNGGFEGGSAPWLVVGYGSVDTVDAGIIPVIDGSYAGRLTLEGGTVTLRQAAFANVPPGSYAVSVNVRAASASTRMFARASTISPSTSFREEFAPTAPNSWQPIAFEFVVPEISDVKLEVGAQGSPGDIGYVDDVRFDGAGPVARPPTPVDTVVSAGTATPLDETATAKATKAPAATKTAAPTRTVVQAVAARIGPGLLNAGFEEVDDSGAPAAWQKYGGALTDSTNLARTGFRAALFESGTASTKWVYQTVSVEPASAHAFAAWVRHDDANVAAAFLRVSWYTTEDGSGSSIGSVDSINQLQAPAPEYRFLTTGAVVVPDDAHSAKLRVMLAPASAALAHIYIDDASFEPASPGDVQVDAPTGRSDASARSVGTKPRGRTQGNAGSGGSADVGGARSPAKVVINEVMYDPDTPGADAEGEWVELFNAGAESVELKGWTLTDNGGSDVLATYNLEPLQYVVVAASDELRRSAAQYSGALMVVGGSIGNSLGNGGDRLTLKDVGGAAADAISWGSDATVLDPAIEDVPAGHSLERRVPGADTDAAEDFVDNVRPSPGGPYQEAAPRGSTLPPDRDAGSLATSGGGGMAWLPWAATAVAAFALALSTGWQAVPMLRRRLHRAG